MQSKKRFPLLFWRAKIPVHQEIDFGSQSSQNSHPWQAIFLVYHLAEQAGIVKVRAIVGKALLIEHTLKRGCI